ncbi:MAG: hypothetical protein LZF86_70031 [Nitrospira sp.]|nr:MAG: hypothetical protein LZF86_70031 [Nitrospira sp.]
MTPPLKTPSVSAATLRGLLACGLLLGLAGCPKADPSKPRTILSASLIQQAYVKASNTETEDWFGRSVALSGNTLVIGALQEDSNATGANGNETDNNAMESGAVYVFTRHGGVWSQQAYLKASNTGAGDGFGYAVALDGDTLVVGAPEEDSSATRVGGDENSNNAMESGAVYVFIRHGGVWSQQAYLKASNTGAQDNFGRSVTLSGDTLVVGAPHEDSNAIGVGGDARNNRATDSGAAYVFTRSGGIWSQEAYLKASNTKADDRFGHSLALSGDTLAVGAYLEASAATGINGNQADNNAAGSGAVYVFTRSLGVWSQQAYVKASNTRATDRFGWSIALNGDTLAVGATQEDSSAIGVGGNQADTGAEDSGATYVFTRHGGVWSQQAYLKASNTRRGDNFGWTVALNGDKLIVGAPNEDSDASGVGGNERNDRAGNSGALYVFTRNRGAWSQQAYVKASNTETKDIFGLDVALSGDTLAVTALYEDSNATGIDGHQTNNKASNSGAVYVFH